MGIEADNPNWPIWPYLEELVLLIFAFEITVRIKYAGCKFFCAIDRGDRFWNLLDFTIVAGGIIDLWLIPTFLIIRSLMGLPNNKHDGQLAQIMMLIRMARLLRILRMVRFIKTVPPLFNLLTAIAEAMGGIVWVFMLTSIVLYIFALLCVKLLRDGIAYGGVAPESVQRLISSVPESVFVLFSVMNGNMEVVKPIFETLPFMKLFFMLFIVVSSWAILSILTSVIAEKMILATDNHRKELARREADQQKTLRQQQLDELFDSIDVNRNGLLDKRELQEVLDNATERLHFLDATSMSVADLLELFDIISSKDGFVHRDDFIKAIDRHTLDVHGHSYRLRVEKKLVVIEDKMNLMFDMMATGSRRGSRVPAPFMGAQRL